MRKKSKNLIPFIGWERLHLPFCTVRLAHLPFSSAKLPCRKPDAKRVSCCTSFSTGTFCTLLFDFTGQLSAASRMAALRSSALKSLESLHKASGKTQVETSRKAASFSTLRNARHSCALSWSAKLGFSEANGRINVSPAAATSSAEVALESELDISYEKLQKLLADGEWELADEETRRLIIVLAGESAVKRKYVFFSEVQFMPVADLQTIDRLWRTYSQGKFGYSVQRKILKRVEGDSTAFFKKVGWMKPLGDTLQFTYRSFPTEFMWELAPSTPEGHLPLTNALRGTQLLKSLLGHPAFEFADDDLQVPSASSSTSSLNGSASRTQPQQQPPKKPLSINYSF